MRINTPVEEEAVDLDGSKQFARAAATLATTAEALATAVRAMVELAQTTPCISGTLKPTTVEASLFPGPESILGDEVRPNDADLSSEVSLLSDPEYADDDFALKDTGVQMLDPAAPCSCGPMSVSQLRFALPESSVRGGDEGSG